MREGIHPAYAERRSPAVAATSSPPGAPAQRRPDHVEACTACHPSTPASSTSSTQAVGSRVPGAVRQAEAARSSYSDGAHRCGGGRSRVRDTSTSRRGSHRRRAARGVRRAGARLADPASTPTRPGPPLGRRFAELAPISKAAGELDGAHRPRRGPGTGRRGPGVRDEAEELAARLPGWRSAWPSCSCRATPTMART